MEASDVKSFYGTIDKWFIPTEIFAIISCSFRNVFLIVDLFWNSTAIPTTLVQLPSELTDTGSKEALCLTYDISSLLQLIAALIIVKLVVSVLLHLRDYWCMKPVFST